ncbi:hypothetical protein [Roseinatronobacter monicus]|nr:hypothetical protein [Roseinatronobacter monicus]
MSGDGDAVMRNQIEQARQEASQLPERRILNTDEGTLLDYLVQKYSAEVPQLDEANISAEHHERQVAVRDFLDGTVNVPGESFEVEIPFNGDSAFFDLRPNQWDSMPPRGTVHGNALHLSIAGRTLQAGDVKQTIDKFVATVNQYLNWHRNQWENFESSLRREVGQEIAHRRERLLAQKGSAAQLATLGIKLKEKPGDTRTFVPPVVKQKVTPQLPPMRASAPPDPTLDQAQYEMILGLIRGAGRSIEQSSSRTRQLDEEALRDMFLVPLNAHFGTATGEAFNYSGKTDIAIRHEGSNLFVAEFKIWGGAKLFLDTISQLLSYLTWRDTKAAVVMFNRNIGFSGVVSTMREATKQHPHFISGPTRLDETSDQYVFSLAQDAERKVTVSILAFDLGPSA